MNPLVEHKQQLVFKKKEGKVMDKIVRINMGAEGGPEVSTEPLGDYAGFGGRAMTSAIVSKDAGQL